MPNTALDDVCTTLRTPARRAAANRIDGAVDVDGAKELEVLGQRHLGHVVEHHVDALDRGVDDGGVADVAEYDLHTGRTIVDVVQVEDADTVSCGDEAMDEERTEVAGAAGDERLHSSSPSSRHQRMLRRIPSYSSTRGSYPSSAVARPMSQAMVWPISPRTCNCCW